MKVSELLKAALENHLAEETDYCGLSKFACHAVNYADEAATGKWGHSEEAAKAKEAIKEHIEGFEDAENYVRVRGLGVPPYEFRQQMMKTLIERFEAQGE